MGSAWIKSPLFLRCHAMNILTWDNFFGTRISLDQKRRHDQNYCQPKASGARHSSSRYKWNLPKKNAAFKIMFKMPCQQPCLIPCLDRYFLSLPLSFPQGRFVSTLLLLLQFQAILSLQSLHDSESSCWYLRISRLSWALLVITRAIHPARQGWILARFAGSAHFYRIRSNLATFNRRSLSGSLLHRRINTNPG